MADLISSNEANSFLFPQRQTFIFNRLLNASRAFSRWELLQMLVALACMHLCEWWELLGIGGNETALGTHKVLFWEQLSLKLQNLSQKTFKVTKMFLVIFYCNTISLCWSGVQILQSEERNQSVSCYKYAQELLLFLWHISCLKTCKSVCFSS